MRIGYSFKSPLLIIGLCYVNISFAAPKMVDRIAVVVNNDVITENSVNQMVKAIKSSTDISELPDDNLLRRQVIDRLVTEHLILQQSPQNSIKITDEVVMKAINNIAKQNNISVEKLFSHLVESGISIKEYRQRIRREMMIEEIKTDQVKRRISITPQEVDALAKIIAARPVTNSEINLSHILIATPESATVSQIQSAKTQANQIVKQVKQGENFARLAAIYSKDNSALSSGDLGWKKLIELPTLFEKELMTAHKNDIIGPIQSAVGFHILKVNQVHLENKKPMTLFEVNARHILLRTNLIFDDRQAKQKLSRLRKQILTGTMTFEEAAKKFSEDINSKNRGGQLGWNVPDNYDDAFRNALLNLNKGEISQPIKSAFGWHLIQLLDKRKEDRTDLIQKNEAYKIIFNRKFSKESKAWLQELRADAYINILDKQ